MNLIGRIAKAGMQVGRVIKDNASYIGPRVGSRAGKIVTGAIEKGVKGGILGANKVVGGLVHASDNHVVRKVGKATAKGIGYTAAEIKNVGSGINKSAKTLKTLGLIKESEDSILTGYKATKRGTGVLVAGAAIAGTVGAAKDWNQSRAGRNVGSTSNAPINTYATMGNAYANNAGATGDLVFALNDQRHTGFL